MANYLTTDTDLTSVANAIRTKGGTSASLAFPVGFVSAIGAIPTGGGALPLYNLGNCYQSTYITLEIRHNHVKLAWRSGGIQKPLQSLNFYNNIVSPVEWFLLKAGSTMTITYKNVVNPDNIIWNCNMRKTNSTTSVNVGIGNDTHLNGAAVSLTPVSDISIGTLFVYAELPQNTAIEFDVEITVDGVRYL